MLSKYRGKCNSCGERFEAGAEIKYEAGKGVMGCPACNIALKADSGAAEATDPSSIEVRVRLGRAIFTKPDGSFCVFACEFDGDVPEASPYKARQEFTVVGPLGVVRQGDVVSVIGNWQANAKTGRQEFKTNTMAALAIAESEAGLKAFLCRNIPHIGPKRAEEMIREFGGREAVLEALENNPKAFVALEGITEERALDMQTAYLEAGGLRDIQLFAAEVGLTESIMAKAIAQWGGDAKSLILEDPYRLAELDRVGFLTADEIARKLKMSGDDPRRCAAATKHLLDASNDDGHTWTTIEDLLQDVKDDFKKTGLTVDNIKLGVSLLEKSRKIRRKGKTIELPPVVTVDGGRIYLSRIEQAERAIATKILRMLSRSSEAKASEVYSASSVTDGETSTMTSDDAVPKDDSTALDIDAVMSGI